MKILIVADDRHIAELLRAELEPWGYEVVSVTDFNHVTELVKAQAPSLILMDITLPFYNGFYWTQQIRAFSEVPIIFISSHSESMDMVQAIQLGGDDYIVKPLNPVITRAKIQALLRRAYDYAVDMDHLSFSDCTLNLGAATLSFNAQTIELTRTELMILETLFRAKGEIARREAIIDYCWQSDNFIDDNTLAVNMTRLRKKLSSIGLETFIVTKKGIGYYLRAVSECL